MHDIVNKNRQVNASRQTPADLSNLKNVMLQEDGDLATLTLNRPKVVNCLSMEMSDELVAVFEHVRRSDTIKMLVIKGAGGNFCAGAAF